MAQERYAIDSRNIRFDQRHDIIVGLGRDEYDDYVFYFRGNQEIFKEPESSDEVVIKGPGMNYFESAARRQAIFDHSTSGYWVLDRMPDLKTYAWLNDIALEGEDV